jgi:hypothetical protein
MDGRREINTRELERSLAEWSIDKESSFTNNN